MDVDAKRKRVTQIIVLTALILIIIVVILCLYTRKSMTSELHWRRKYEVLENQYLQIATEEQAVWQLVKEEDLLDWMKSFLIEAEPIQRLKIVTLQQTPELWRQEIDDQPIGDYPISRQYAIIFIEYGRDFTSSEITYYCRIRKENEKEPWTLVGYYTGA